MRPRYKIFDVYFVSLILLLVLPCGSVHSPSGPVYGNSLEYCGVWNERNEIEVENGELIPSFKLVDRESLMSVQTPNPQRGNRRKENWRK